MRGHSLAIANHSTSHLAWQLTGWSPRQGGGSKKRPILILWLDGDDVVAAVVTSAKPRTQTDVLLNDWSASGLRVASTVRLSRLDGLEQSLLLAKIGRISETDAEQLKRGWEMYIKPQF